MKRIIFHKCGRCRKTLNNKKGSLLDRLKVFLGHTKYHYVLCKGCNDELKRRR